MPSVSEMYINTNDSTSEDVDFYHQRKQYMEFVAALEPLVEDTQMLPAQDQVRSLVTLAANPESMYPTMGKSYATSDQCLGRRALRLLNQIKRMSLGGDGNEMADAFDAMFKVPYSDVRKRARKQQSLYDNDPLANEDIPPLFKNKKAKKEGSPVKKDDDDDMDELLKMVAAGADSSDDEAGSKTDSDTDMNTENDLRLKGMTPMRSDDENRLDYADPIPRIASTEMKDVFGTCVEVWRMVGWAFTCSTVSNVAYSNRWKQWKPVFEFLLEVLETNLEQKGPKNSIITNWLEHVGLADAIQAVLATMQIDEDSEDRQILMHFKPVLTQEKVPHRTELTARSTTYRYDSEASFLRSRFLDLIIASNRADIHVENVREQCRSALLHDQTHDIIIGSGSPPSDRLHTLSRIVWSSHLDVHSVPDYIRHVSISLDTMCEFLKATPSRVIRIDNQTAALGVLVCLYDALLIYLKSWSATDIEHKRKMLKHAFRYGQQERTGWYSRKNLAQNHEIQHMEDSIGHLFAVFLL